MVRPHRAVEAGWMVGGVYPDDEAAVGQDRKVAIDRTAADVRAPPAGEAKYFVCGQMAFVCADDIEYQLSLLGLSHRSLPKSSLCSRRAGEQGGISIPGASLGRR
jgi:hypothetical protein